MEQYCDATGIMATCCFCVAAFRRTSSFFSESSPFALVLALVRLLSRSVSELETVLQFARLLPHTGRASPGVRLDVRPIALLSVSTFVFVISSNFRRQNVPALIM